MLVARERLEVSDETLEHNARGVGTTAKAPDDVFRAHWLTYPLRWILDAMTAAGAGLSISGDPKVLMRVRPASSIRPSRQQPPR